MWMFTKYGMFSVVFKDGGMQVRSRNRKHLEALKHRCMSLGAKHWKILDTPRGDYGWRIKLTRDEWVKVAALLASEIDYANFKDAARDSKVDRRFVDALHDVWMRLFQYQRAVTWPSYPEWRSEELPGDIHHVPGADEDEGDFGTEFDF